MKHIITVLLFLLLLNSCNFKRFTQENYICASNKLVIKNINIIKTNSIEKAYVIIDNVEYLADIRKLNKKEIVLLIENIVIEINKSRKEVIAKFNEKIYFLRL